MNLKDKAVLITGANRGIGQALVAEALRRGAQRVYAGTRRPLTHPDARVTPLTLDVTDASQIHAALARVESLDILINNAGVALNDDLTDRSALESHLAVNLFGTYGVTGAFVPLLIRSRGAIVNVLSVAAIAALPIVPGLLDLKSGRILPDAIGTRSFGRTRCEGACRPLWPRRHGNVTKPQRPEGFPGVRRTSHLRRRGERRRGDFPGSHVGVASGKLEPRGAQSTRARERDPRASSGRHIKGDDHGDTHARSRAAPGRTARRVGACARATSREGKGIDPRPRRARRRASANAVVCRRAAVRVRWTQWESEPARSLRGAPSADRVPRFFRTRWWTAGPTTLAAAAR